MLTALTHSPQPLTADQLCERTGYKTVQQFWVSLRFLEANSAIKSNTNEKGETVYLIGPKGKKV
jgi:hypothetical protein